MWGAVQMAVTALFGRREFAHFDKDAQNVFSKWKLKCTMNKGFPLSSRRSPTLQPFTTANTGWPAFSPSRPTPVCCRILQEIDCAIGYQRHLVFDDQCDRNDSDTQDITKVGLGLCKRHQSSSRQWRSSDWLVALITTWNAASWVQALGLQLRKFWAQIAQAAWLSVQPLASSVTTRACADKVKTNARTGRFMNCKPSSGPCLGGGFAF